MDQFASSCCKEGKALLIDCKTSTGKLYSFDDEAVCLVVTNTNIKHSHSGGEYGARVRECKEASKILGVAVLRDETDASKAGAIQDETLRRRARHVISEDNRTLEAAKAAEAKDWTAFGKLMNESHASLRDDFEVSCKELDFLVAHAQKLPGVFGSRMTGGGFGGCTVTLVARDHAASLIELLKEDYKKEFGIECTSYVFKKPDSGARILFRS
jgi:galactokinase